MGNDERKPFKDFGEYLGSDFNSVIDEIVAVKKGMSQRLQSFKQKLQEIKGLAVSLKKNYLIKKGGDKDQSLDCLYYDFIIEAWDSIPSKEPWNPKDGYELANHLIKAGFDVEKKNKG